MFKKFKAIFKKLQLGKIWKKHWKKIAVVAVVVAIGIWRRPKPPTYTEHTVTRESVKAELTVSGSLAADKAAELKFQTGGRLAWIGVKEGDRVNQSQAIASLDKRQLQKTLEKELNDYLKTRWDFEDEREARNVTTDNLDIYSLSNAARRVLEKAQFDLNNTVLDVEIQTVTNEFATIISPFAGLVSEIHQPNPGINLAATDIIATIIDPDTMYFRAEVDELDIGTIKVGQPVTLILDSFPNEELETTISEIGFSPIALSGGGTGYVVKIALPVSNGDLKYKLGMNGDATIVLADKGSTLVLPLEATLQRNGKTLVQQLSDNEIVEKEIQVGLETETVVEVITGLKEGDKVVTSEKK